MSKRTIRILDLLCDAANWNASLENAFDDERVRWTARRDRALAKLRATVAALTAEEVALINRRYRPQELAAQLRQIGIEPPFGAVLRH